LHNLLDEYRFIEFLGQVLILFQSHCHLQTTTQHIEWFLMVLMCL
jgi:hypothetical protein